MAGYSGTPGVLVAKRVAALFDSPPPGVIQLENGQFGAMTRATRAAHS